ncbi:MAG TPA: peptide MFS transporter [Bacteroidales bacterium]|nr:peptide MFS transporter [Bacteroidales bacterium]
MFKGHPKGLFVAFFANMGERFGYYTMIAIFTLFLQAKYGYSAATATQIFSIFLAAVYFLPLFGGILADRFLGYGKTISIGLIVMFLGYLLLSIPTNSENTAGLGVIIAALAVISIGTGLFKGNLQALVGNMYDDPRYSKNRDNAFNIFYMGINVGAMFAPTAAEKVSNFILKKYDLFYKGDIPALAHKYLNGDTSVSDRLSELAAAQPAKFASLSDFASTYINALSESYHYAFGVACLSLIVSMLIFWSLKKYYKTADMTEKQKAASSEHKDQIIQLSPVQVRQRLIALGLVFFVVIFFWMAFHQNGAAMTIFARDYTVDNVNKFTNLWFDLFGLLPIFFAVVSLYFVIKKGSETKTRLLGGVGVIVFAALAYLRFQTYEETNDFTPQMFQHFNPFFIVALTPIVVGIFSWLGKKGKEPSSPKKIAIGMLITSVAFMILVIGSLSLIGASPKELGETRAAASDVISTYWLISTYFMLTIAELFLSPIGISFVSKVAPPHLKGSMQGGWFAATAVGNYAVGLVGLLWASIPLWAFWSILVLFCLLSAGFIFAVLKRLEKAASS